MARWQLTEPHYLNVPGTQTEDRSMGDRGKKKLSTPMHLDPNMESDWNYQEMIGRNIIEGKIIVCHEGKGEPRDIVFVGDPTPGMLPIDDEAREITAKFNWKPTQGLDDISQADSFTQKLLMNLLTDTAEAKEKAQAQQQAEGLGELMKGLAQMMSVQTQLLAALTGKHVAVQEPTVEATKAEPAKPDPTRATSPLAARRAINPIPETVE